MTHPQPSPVTRHEHIQKDSQFQGFQELIDQEVTELGADSGGLYDVDEWIPGELASLGASDEHERGRGRDRRSFLNRLLLGAGAAVPALLAAEQAEAHGGRPTPNDYINLRVLLYMLRDSAQRVPQFFVNLRKHENDHVDFLVDALGSNARPKPTFRNLQPRSFQQFVQITQALENTGVGAYLGAAPKIDNPDFLAAAGSIALVEGRHAGTVNFLLKSPVVPQNRSFEQPLTPQEVVSRAGMFIASLNGGPPLDYSMTPSPQNDVAILNFALALEYLEAEFYNLNVPRFFGGICRDAR